MEFWLHSMREERARVLMAEQYERARMASANLVASFYESAGREPPLPPRDFAIVIESMAIGQAIQAALDPDAINMSLQGRVIAMLMGLPISPSATAAQE
jgi:hypothetical protein